MAERREVLWPDFDSLDSTHLLWCGGSSDESAETEQRADRVRAAVACVLSPKQREVVEAYFFHGLSQGQIATRLGITQQVVQRRLYGAVRDGQRIGGALRKLRTALAPHLTP